MKKTQKKKELFNTIEQLTNIIDDIHDTRYLAIVLLQCFEIKSNEQEVSSLIIKDAYKTLNKTIIYKLVDIMDDLENIKSLLNIEQ